MRLPRDYYVSVRRRFALLTPQERWWWLSCLPLGGVTAALETVSGLLIFALMGTLLGSSGGRIGAVLGSLLAGVGIGVSTKSLTALCAAFYIAKNLVWILATYYRSHVMATIGASLSGRFIRAYLTAPYAFHLRRNYTDTAYGFTSGVPAIVHMLEAVVTLVTELLVVVGLSVVLMRVALVETLTAAGIIGVSVLTFSWFTKGRFQVLGERHATLGGDLDRQVLQALAAFREVTVFGRASTFARRIADVDARRLDAAMDFAALEGAPRLWTETAFILGLAGLVLALDVTSLSLQTVIPFIGLYAYAGFRLIPAGHRLSYQLNRIRFEVAASEVLCRDAERLVPAAEAHVTSPAEQGSPHPWRSLTLTGVSFAYESTDRLVLSDISLSVAKGDCLAVVGATGAGKSTLADLIMGLLVPTSGAVLLDGVSIHDDLPSWQRHIGYVPQAPYLLDDTLGRNIAFGIPDEDVDAAAIRAAVEAAQLGSLVASLPDGLNTVIGDRGTRLSGGERQRVSIARALYRDASLLVLDEATSALDPGTERALSEAIDDLRGRTTLLVIAHRLSTIERADRLIVLNEGRIEAVGTYAELRDTSAVFRAISALDA